MPKVTEYTPEVDASGPAGGVDPNLEVLSEAGHGIEDFGRELQDGNAVLQDRIGQMESSDAAAQVANLRDKYTEQIQNQTADGTLDTQTLKDQYQNDISDLAQQYDTPMGRDTFNRQSARLGGMLAVRAMRGQTVVAMNNAKTDFENFANTNADVIRQDPSQFHDVWDASMEHLNTLQQQGLLPPVQAQQAIQNLKYQYAMSSIMGTATTNPQAAKAMLDRGEYGSANDETAGFLNAQQLSEAYRQVSLAQSASDTETERAYRLQQQAQAAQSEAWEQNALPNLVKNSLSTKDILNSPLTADQKYRWMGMLSAAQKTEINVDPALKNSLYDRMLLPDNDPNKISDPSQIQDYVVAGKISPQDYTAMTSWFDKTPQGQALNANRKSLLDYAKSQLVSKNGTIGASDPDGQLKLMQFTNALQQAESQARSSNQPVSPLYDVNSKQFFGNQVQNFMLSPQERFGLQAQRLQGNLSAPEQGTTQPGVIPNQGNQAPIPSLWEYSQRNQAPEPRIRVKGPNGKMGTVPKSQLPDALKAGYQEINGGP